MFCMIYNLDFCDLIFVEFVEMKFYWGCEWFDKFMFFVILLVCLVIVLDFLYK